MKFRADTTEELRKLSGFGCCTERRVNERGWCRTCGHQIADLDATDSGISILMRMDRSRVAEIKPHWTPRKEKTRQLTLDLVEQDRAEEIDWGDNTAQDQEPRPYWSR